MRFQTLIIGLVLSAMTTPLAAQWQAGVAKVRITPTKPLRMGGYASRSRPADGTLTDLWAKALVLQDDNGAARNFLGSNTSANGSRIATKNTKRHEKQKNFLTEAQRSRRQTTSIKKNFSRTIALPALFLCAFVSL